LGKVRWVVSTVRDRSINNMLLRSLKQHGYQGKIAVTTYNRHDEVLFRESGIDKIFVPYRDAAREAAERLH
jgi:Trk K+ transport system NAD-binding subunit